MPKHETKSRAAWIASLDEAERRAFLDGLSGNALAALPWLWEFWAHPDYQLAPGGDWATWVILAGRGAGKTRAGAEWVRSRIEGPKPHDPGPCSRIALVGETIEQVRAVMVEGDSGLMAVTPPDRRPNLVSSKNLLIWPNGAQASLVSAANPEALRGPQFDGAWSDEIGCPSVDLGANQPNLFADAKSSESALPYGSLGIRDDEMQRRFLQAKIGYWTDPDNMPISALTGLPMIPQDRIFVWTWDTRPWPDFPVRESVWSDGPAHRLGHWITGRVSASGLAEVVASICRRAGLSAYDVSDLFGSVDGYIVERVAAARDALQPLMLAYGFDAFESGGRVVFRMRGRAPALTLDDDFLVAPRGSAATSLERLRASAGTAFDAVRLTYVQSESDYRVGASEARLPGGDRERVAESSFPLALPGSRAQQIVDRWLAEGWRSRDRANFTMGPAEIAVEPGDTIDIDRAGAMESYRVERIVDGEAREVEAVRVDTAIHQPNVTPERNVETDLPSLPGPMQVIYLDLPLATGEAEDYRPRIAVAGDPWADRAAVYRSQDDETYELIASIAKPALVGTTLEPLATAEPGRWQRASLRVGIATGALESADRLRVLNGANRAALEYAPDAWEIVQFRDATLVGPGEYVLSTLLRGQRGTDAVNSAVIASGARFVLLDSAVTPLPMTIEERGLARHYRVGPARFAPSHASYRHDVQAFDGVGLRPHAPAHLEARRDQLTGDLRVSWVRTGRFGADSWAGLEIPQTEEREEYRLRIFAGGALLREVTGASTAFTYDAAMQTSDGANAPLELRVAQLSTIFGYGPERVLITDE